MFNLLVNKCKLKQDVLFQQVDWQKLKRLITSSVGEDVVDRFSALTVGGRGKQVQPSREDPAVPIHATEVHSFQLLGAADKCS